MNEIEIEKSGGHWDFGIFYSVLASLQDGMYRVSVRRCRKVRTSPQNRYLFGCVYPLLLMPLVDLGTPVRSCEEVHVFFKLRFLGKEYVNRDTGEVDRFGTSTSSMTTTEFWNYVSLVRDFAEEYLGVFVPEPDKKWRTLINRADEYGNM